MYKRQLKDRVGGERLEVHLERAKDAERAIRVLAEISDEEPSLDDRTVRAPLHRRSGVITQAVRRLDEAGVAIDDIALSRPTLDDVFIALTGRAAVEEPSAEVTELEEAA